MTREDVMKRYCLVCDKLMATERGLAVHLKTSYTHQELTNAWNGHLVSEEWIAERYGRKA